MADTAVEEAVEVDDGAAPKRRSRSLLIALLASLLLGGGAFYAVYAGLVPLGGAEGSHAMADGDDGTTRDTDDPGRRAYETPSFVALEPFIISLGEDASAKHLKVSLTIEVAPGTEEGVKAAIPRINDVLNTYLRAVDQRDFEVPRAMLRLRAQMLRRVSLVTPPDAVRDLLFQEFILN